MVGILRGKILFWDATFGKCEKYYIQRQVKEDENEKSFGGSFMCAFTDGVQ